MYRSIILVLVVVGLAWSCKKTGDTASTSDVTPPSEQIIVSKNITTGTSIDLSTSSVGSSGATVKIAKPNTPVDGIEIVVPANAYTSNPTLKISYAEIKSHQFGANFNPISPIISISCDGGYSNGLMSLTIPVKIPAGHIPLGFYLDESTGKLESIPFSNITDNSITLLTRHFLPASKLKSGGINLKGALSTGANIVISSIAESVLNQQPIISSGFKPGVDDWEFINFGSYLVPGGHCAGQNMAAMWYYFEKKSSDGSLFNKLSDNPKLWQDNARGYRFCSVIHSDLDWEGTVSSMFDKYVDKNQELDKLKLYTIAGAMLVTGEPQGIGIYRQTGVKTDGTPKYAGHDLICYQVSVSGGKLYISDPNTPGTGQTIDFANNKFSPYLAKLNGEDASNPYPFVTYYAKTAYIEWNKIGKRWEEVTNNTIGTIAPNIFPSYTIWAKTGAGFELKDGATLTSDTLRTIVICPTAAISFDVKNQKIIGQMIFDKDGNSLAVQEGNGSAYVKLKPGLTKLGYYIIGWKESSKNLDGTYRDKYIDFKWINVYFASLKISANQTKGEITKEVKFTAQTGGSAPKSAKYVWNFGDGTAAVTNTNDSTAVHTYAKAGTFVVKTELFDNSTGTKITEATKSFDVVDPNAIPLNFSYTLTDGVLSYDTCCIFSYKVNLTGSIESKSYYLKTITIDENGLIMVNVGMNPGVTKPDLKISYNYTVSNLVTFRKYKGWYGDYEYTLLTNTSKLSTQVYDVLNLKFDLSKATYNTFQNVSGTVQLAPAANYTYGYLSYISALMNYSFHQKLTVPATKDSPSSVTIDRDVPRTPPLSIGTIIVSIY